MNFTIRMRDILTGVFAPSCVLFALLPFVSASAEQVDVNQVQLGNMVTYQYQEYAYRVPGAPIDLEGILEKTGNGTVSKTIVEINDKEIIHVYEEAGDSPSEPPYMAIFKVDRNTGMYISPDVHPLGVIDDFQTSGTPSKKVKVMQSVQLYPSGRSARVNFTMLEGPCAGLPAQWIMTHKNGNVAPVIAINMGKASAGDFARRMKFYIENKKP